MAKLMIRNLGRCLFVILFVCHLVPHNFKIIAYFRLQVNPFLVIIFVESALGRPILKALGYLDNLEDVSVLCRVVDFLAEELVNHLLLGCAKRKGVTHYVIGSGQFVVARVGWVLLHLKGDI